MKRYVIVPVLALLIAAAASAAVDPTLLSLVMPDAKVLCGVQVQQSLASPFGQYMLSGLMEDDAVARFAAATGFDVRRDLREILVASYGAANRSNTLILARAAIPSDKVIAFALLTGATAADYHGVPVITPRPGGTAAAFLDSSTVAIGNEKELQGLIDRRAGQILFSGPLAQKAQDAGANTDAWFATVTPLVDLIPAAPSGVFNPAALLASVIESWAGVQFDSNGVTVSAEALTHSATEAQGLAGVLKLATGMVKGTPAAALQNAQVSASGAVTRITLTVAEQDLERSFPAGPRRRAAR